MSVASTEAKNWRKSVREVYLIIKGSADPISSKEIGDISNYSARTVRNALKNLREDGLIGSKYCLLDLRKRLYFVRCRQPKTQ